MGFRKFQRAVGLGSGGFGLVRWRLLHMQIPDPFRNASQRQTVRRSSLQSVVPLKRHKDSGGSGGERPMFPEFQDYYWVSGLGMTFSIPR